MNGVAHIQFKEVRGDVEIRYTETHDFFDPDYNCVVLNAYYHARHIPTGICAGVHQKHHFNEVPQSAKAMAVRGIIAAITPKDPKHDPR